ncbi:MAG: hypothetical protein IKC69_01845, partial [Clostridia bacterium]|nr:hypothetical protein [Clostridia bacterium]
MWGSTPHPNGGFPQGSAPHPGGRFAGLRPAPFTGALWGFAAGLTVGGEKNGVRIRKFTEKHT